MFKAALLLYAALFYGVVFFWRSYQTWRRTGVNPYRLRRQGGVRGLAGRVYSLLSLASALVVGLYAFADSLYAYLPPIPWLAAPWISSLGLMLLFAALAWILTAQAQMGEAWRIGIDEDTPAGLVTRGVFRFSRNPIFLGTRLNLLGLFLALPNAVTLVIWLLGDVMLQVQVLLEEAHLQETYGEEYREYARRVRRWL